MESYSNSPDDSARRTRRPLGWSGVLAIFIAVLHAIIIGGLLRGGFVGHILYVGLISSGYLAMYVFGPLAVLLWTVFMIRRLFAGGGWGSVIRSGLKGGVIVFGGLGLVLWTFAAIPPNARAFCCGYWIHAKLVVDVDEIRLWAEDPPPVASRFDPIAQEHWPASLHRLAHREGKVICDAKSKTVTFYEGGEYGHWGLTVARPGTKPPDDRYTIMLEDGVWVWRE